MRDAAISEYNAVDLIVNSRVKHCKCSTLESSTTGATQSDELLYSIAMYGETSEDSRPYAPVKREGLEQKENTALARVMH